MSDPSDWTRGFFDPIKSVMSKYISSPTPPLTPDSIKSQHADEVSKVNTFKPNGVSNSVATDYLQNHPDGKLLLKMQADADPSATPKIILERSLQQIASGQELPTRVDIDQGEKLYKISPPGSKVSAFSPYWATEKAIDEASQSKEGISKKLATPIASESSIYDLHSIEAKDKTVVFKSKVAPTTELGGTVSKPGGGEQCVVLDRGKNWHPSQVERQIPNHPAPSQYSSLFESFKSGNYSTGFLQARNLGQSLPPSAKGPLIAGMLAATAIGTGAYLYSQHTKGTPEQPKTEPKGPTPPEQSGGPLKR